MPLLTQGDIVFALFPYEEDKTIVKQRPCLVLAVDNQRQLFLAAKITTTRLSHSWAIHLHSGETDMSIGSIKTESWINLNRREWIPFSDYIFKIGKVNSNILNNIIQKFN